MSKVVSVPLRGKEGAGRFSMSTDGMKLTFVSVPLRGKEGAGHTSWFLKDTTWVGFRPLAG